MSCSWVMPSLRLSPEDARDIATYLTSLKTDATYPGDVAFMDDPQLAERGRQLVTRYGCGSCHEIHGFEDATRLFARGEMRANALDDLEACVGLVRRSIETRKHESELDSVVEVPHEQRLARRGRACGAHEVGDVA